MLSKLYQLDALKALVKGYSSEISQVRDTSQFCFDTMQLGQSTTEVIPAVTRAIFSKSVVACHYESLSKETVKRQILPQAVFYSGHQWYVRVYYRKTNEFRNFVCTRFSRIGILDSDAQTNELAEKDIDCGDSLNVSSSGYKLRLNNLKQVNKRAELVIASTN